MSPALPAEEPFSDSDESLRRLLLVALQDEVVALPADPVLEVIPARPYARLPGAPAPVAGIANRRGRILTVVDLGRALNHAPAAAGDEHRIVVVTYGGRELGLAVRDVLQITPQWWSESRDDGDETVPERDGRDRARGEQLRVIELDSVFAPLFRGGDPGVGEPTSERS